MEVNMVNIVPLKRDISRYMVFIDVQKFDLLLRLFSFLDETKWKVFKNGEQTFITYCPRCLSKRLESVILYRLTLYGQYPQHRASLI